MRAFCAVLFLFIPFSAGDAVVYEPPPFPLGSSGKLVAYPTHRHTGFLLADFTLDGLDDVAAWDDASHRLVLYHSQAGHLAEAQILDLPPNADPNLIFIRYEGQTADFNADSRPDLVLLEEGTARFLILLSQADGRLAPPQIWRNDSASYALGWLPLDLNADGRADLAFTEEDDRLVVAIQRDGYVFDRQWWPYPGFRGRGLSAASGELPSLAWTVQSPKGERRTLLFRNQGDTRFLPALPLRQNTKSGAYLWGDLIPDRTGDGFPDLIQRDPAKDTIVLWQGNGTEVFRLHQTLSAEVFGAASWTDLDSDGQMDLIEEDQSRACYFLSLAKGQLARPACEGYERIEKPIQKLWRGRLNADSLPDRILLAEGCLHVSLGQWMLLGLQAPQLPADLVATGSLPLKIELTARMPTFIAPRGFVRLLRDREEFARFPLESLLPQSRAGFVPAEENVARVETSIALPAGYYLLSLDFQGDPNFMPSVSPETLVNLPPHATATQLHLAAPSWREDQELRWSAKVSPAHPRAAAPAGSLSLRRDGREIASVPLVKGAASGSLKQLLPGASLFTAEYVPDSSYFASESKPVPGEVVGLLTMKNAAPSSLWALEAKGLPGPGPWPLKVGALTLSARRAGPALIEVLLPASVPLGAQSVVLSAASARWEGRATISRTAPQIAAASSYWSLLEAASMSTRPLESPEPFPLSAWLAKPGAKTTLTLFGTGWRNATAAQLSVTLGSTRLTVLGFGPHDGIPGLDYLTLQVPATFRPPSASTLTPATRLQMTAAGVAAGPILLNLR